MFAEVCRVTVVLLLCSADMERRLDAKREEVTSLEHNENIRLEQQKADLLEKRRKEVKTFLKCVT